MGHLCVKNIERAPKGCFVFACVTSITEETFKYGVFEMVVKCCQLKSTSDKTRKHTVIKVGLGHKDSFLSGNLVQRLTKVERPFKRALQQCDERSTSAASAWRRLLGKDCDF
jgi:hypothetical protein